MGLVVSRPWPSQLIQAVERASQEAKRFFWGGGGGGAGSVPGKYPEKVKYVLNLCFSVQVLCFPKKECDSMWRLSGWSWSLRFSGWPLSGIRIKSPHCHWGQQHPNWKRTGINCLRRLRDNSIEDHKPLESIMKNSQLRAPKRLQFKECYCSYRSLSLE